MTRWAMALLLAFAASASAEVPEPEGYRGAPYGAPVPASLQGAEVIDAARAIDLHDQGAAFIDVYPRTRKPQDLPEGTIWQEPRHDTIPGAIWLWDTGYERLSPDEEARLRNGLASASGGDRSAPLVIFCRADCWMSWNAAKRAVAMGYDAVKWFPGGTDEWQQASDADLVAAVPVTP
ncbi:MAG: PQQ-dependent catabolism-associated CXXCW motif protein [Paracoccus sp. (in: a-proteobacteria)]|jgi:PQQ-dependent catabolism-associated CXXCW motif protein|uniref:PQQ-dependent catabolism-associated CXXCW motif protein n=1 Tax=unclassified Paracoccus (in: a-proteobacteria) TaxID=2688777 RepID=UPI000C53A65B|nr:MULTISPECIES: PQQ-dependent catabolism-associated CXXCW motif protein [unclassified Paracoccus (in: a-proteobacteria)]MAN56870.1 rhodanese [Paracoccus sp. (in: a-proteobacteria)]MBA48530.1 rhodanese [Paracoccus sp. (in: a-proteobacteria)]MCS5601591.1 PQQ-dependent catabolism-associated CXXCW motif protein [Paracoccus sp. (in: a-proteobacteria)]MDB2490620.1 PQQ-dependent catabolism-associated CXXCW motif protein [Paracoccus sp. (in: a-proteobacteria)]HIC67327.1 PQQ-dependent catabolism-assoc|tara:strand:+ start:1505 stop:2038 length:534 start_codon:yes stop_codon:yes gene_type:complete